MTAAFATLRPTRNATESSILAAARDALAAEPYDHLTIEGIARRAFVSRTAVYFYFPGKRAVVDRLIQQAFTDMYRAAAPYLEGDAAPRAALRIALARVVEVIGDNAHLLILAVRLSGEEDRLPPEWAPYVRRFVGAAADRIARDQRRGIAASDIPAGISAQALVAMVESHLTRDVMRGTGDANESVRVLTELWWRAVYSRPAAEG